MSLQILWFLFFRFSACFVSISHFPPRFHAMWNNYVISFSLFPNEKSVRVFLEKNSEKNRLKFCNIIHFLLHFCRAKMISSDILVLKQLVRGSLLLKKQQLANEFKETKEQPRKGNSFHHFCSCSLPFPNLFPQFASLVLGPTFRTLVNKESRKGSRDKS